MKQFIYEIYVNILTSVVRKSTWCSLLAHKFVIKQNNACTIKIVLWVIKGVSCSKNGQHAKTTFYMCTRKNN